MPLTKCVSYMHLISERLTPQNLIQRSLFDAPPPSPLDQLKAAVNEKLGRFAVRSGDTLAIKELYEDEANDYDICDVAGKMCF
ncbi:MAG: hypothetical protein R3C11_12630 [Planctomycetaceae bacterium]